MPEFVPWMFMLGKTSNPFSFAILVAIICHLRLSPYGPSPGTSEPSELSFGMWCGPLSLRSFSWFPSWKLKMHRVCSRCLSCQWRQDECLLEIPPFWSKGDAFSIRHLSTRQGDTVRVFAAARASAECAFALSLAAGAVRVCVFVRPSLPLCPVSEPVSPA